MVRFPPDFEESSENELDTRNQSKDLRKWQFSRSLLTDEWDYSIRTYLLGSLEYEC